MDSEPVTIFEPSIDRVVIADLGRGSSERCDSLGFVEFLRI